MKLNSPVNQALLFLKIFALHVLIYFSFFACIGRSLSYFYKNWGLDLNFFTLFFIAPLGGILGFLDGFPVFVIPYVLLFYCLKQYLFKNKWFVSFVISSLIIYSSVFIYLCINDGATGLYFGEKFEDRYEVNILVIMIPSLLMSFLINWLVFRKTYQKLKESE
jgi:hypothetical protein